MFNDTGVGGGGESIFKICNSNADGCALVFVEFIELRLLRGATQLNKMTTHCARENEIKHKKRKKKFVSVDDGGGALN